MTQFSHDEIFYCVFRNLSNPKIKGAIVFHQQGPLIFDYSIRLNHTWAFSGFPDVKAIMDVNGPYLDDLELGMSIIPTLQYGFSGFLTVWLLYLIPFFSSHIYCHALQYNYVPLVNIMVFYILLPWPCLRLWWYAVGVHSLKLFAFIISIFILNSLVMEICYWSFPFAFILIVLIFLDIINSVPFFPLN